MLSATEEKTFQEATLCYICQRELGADKLRDHMHLPHTYCGAAHAHCNLQFQFRQGKRSQSSKFYIPIVFHNLIGYDSHLLMESAGKMCKRRKLTVIPKHSEKYLSFSVGNLRFIDSLQFLNESFEKLVTNLSKEDASKFESLASHFPDKDEFGLLLRKGVYSCGFVSSPTIFNEASQPPENEFYNKLCDTEISDADYEHAQTMWRTFQMTDFGSITTFIWKQISSCWQMCLKTSERCVKLTTNSIQPIITLLLDLHGTPCWKWREQSSNYSMTLTWSYW